MFENGNVVKIWGVFLVLGIIMASLQIYLAVVQIRNYKVLQEIKEIEKKHI